MSKEIKVYANYDNFTIRVYQAFNNSIADEAIQLGTFGSKFNFERMTWIKTSFLWMMYRSGWGTKKDQERILAIDIQRMGFDGILSNAVLTTFNENVFISYEEWKSKLKHSEVRCQFDPDRDIYGSPINQRAIQLGLKGKMVRKYTKDWIVRIADLTNQVTKWRKQIEEGSFNAEVLTEEFEYPVCEKTRKLLGIE